MHRSCLALALCTVGCGQVASHPIDAGPADAPNTVTYHGTLAATQPVNYGGKPYCNYSLVLQQVSLELVLIPSDTATMVVSGHAEALNVESKDAACTLGVIPTNIARYNFAPAAPVSGATALSFIGDAANQPPATLSVQLMQAGSVYQANLGFRRSDNVDASLVWSVLATVSLSPAS